MKSHIDLRLPSFLRIGASTLPMGLSDRDIREELRNGNFKIHPKPRELSTAGIDLRINRDLTVAPHEHALVACIERIEMSTNLLGILHIRSSLAREGLFASLAVVDPGFRGQLTISLYNAGNRIVHLKHGERFIQLSLLRLNSPPSRIYSGKYQDSWGIVESRRSNRR